MPCGMASIYYWIVAMVICRIYLVDVALTVSLHSLPSPLPHDLQELLKIIIRNHSPRAKNSSHFS